MSNFVAGPFGDKYGRRALLSWSVVFLVACSILSALSIGLVTYVLSRFLVGFALQGVTLGQSVWSFELTGPDYRSQVQAYGSFISLLGMAALTAVSVVVHNWRLLLVLSACITCIPLLFVRWVILVLKRILRVVCAVISTFDCMETLLSNHIARE